MDLLLYRFTGLLLTLTILAMELREAPCLSLSPHGRYDGHFDKKGWRLKTRPALTKQAYRATPSSDTALPISFHRNISVSHGGKERTYGVLAPAVLAGKLPAVLMYHGSGSDAAAFASEGSMATEAPRRGYIVAYLEAVPTSGYSTRVWNSGSASGLSEASQPDDVGYTSKVVADLVDKYDVDPKRVYVAGISSGGSMALRAACELPKLIAGVASVHGSLESHRGEKCATKCKPHGSCEWDSTNPDCTAEAWQEKLEPVFTCDGIKENKVAVFLLNGNRDWFTARKGEVWVTPTAISSQHPRLAKNLEKNLKPYSYPPRTYMYESFARAAGCSDSKEVSFKNGTGHDTTECSSYTGCGANLTTCIAKAGHWWYGIPYNVTTPCLHKGYPAPTCTPESQFWDYGRTTQSIETTSEILAFFGRNRKN